MNEIHCSDSFCTAKWWESKYKALRGAFVAWRRIERQDRKALRKNIQRLRQLAFDWKNGDANAYWTMKNLLFDMAALADE